MLLLMGLLQKSSRDDKSSAPLVTLHFRMALSLATVKRHMRMLQLYTVSPD